MANENKTKKRTTNNDINGNDQSNADTDGNHDGLGRRASVIGLLVRRRRRIRAHISYRIVNVVPFTTMMLIFNYCHEHC